MLNIDKIVKLGGNIKSVICFAATEHEGQFRKNSTKEPFINHPIRVALLLIEHGVTDTDIISAAILHDVVEDTNTTMEEIELRFGDKIAGIVKEVTDNKQLLKADRKKIQIAHSGEMSTGGKFVKLSDKIDNTRSLLTDPPLSWTPEYIKGYSIHAYKVVEGLRGVNEGLEDEFDEIMLDLGIIYMDFSELEELLEKFYDGMC